MAFESLAEKLGTIFKKITGKGKVSEKNVRESMREIKLALLEADVNYGVVKDLISRISERAVGTNVLESLTPGQQIIKITDQELLLTLGKEANVDINYQKSGITVIMLVGLQGSGKTTTAGKLARHIEKSGRSPLLVACDVYRPAGIDQLKIVGQQLSIPVFSLQSNMENSEKSNENVIERDVTKIVEMAMDFAKEHGNNVVILDTAGRLHTDDELICELKKIKNNLCVHETLLVVDSMTGQDAVNVAVTFNDAISIDGTILTKLDGDTRGGAAISIGAVVKKPIKFVGNGEKLENLELFYPDRMASRILGMGDVLSLIDKIEQSVSEKEADKLEKQINSQRFTLDDYLSQLQQMKKMGPISNLMSMVPGLSSSGIDSSKIDEKRIYGVGAIIQSMTKRERKYPTIINASRKRRISAGSGKSIQEINLLLKQFEQMQSMIKKLGKMGNKGLGKFKMPFI